MKKILLLAATFVLAATTNAQTPTEQGNVIIDPYIGFPNWANATLYDNENWIDGSLVENYKVNGGPISYGGRVEYMLADNFGMGVDVNYEVSGYNYDDTRSVYDSVNMTYVDTKYNYDYKSKKLRVMARLNYHFVQNERVDAYSGFAAGYKNVSRVFSSTDPTAFEDESGELFPISFRLAVGTRVYFTDNIGAMLELGIFGGSILQFGLSAKF